MAPGRGGIEVWQLAKTFGCKTELSQRPKGRSCARPQVHGGAVSALARPDARTDARPDARSHTGTYSHAVAGTDAFADGVTRAHGRADAEPYGYAHGRA